MHTTPTVLLALAFLATALDAAAQSDPRTPESVYHEYCSVCHGDKGDGRSRASGSLSPPPRDFTTPTAAGELDRERMIRSVGNGVPGTAMTAWANQLSTVEIEGVVDYIRAQFMLAGIHDTIRAREIYAENCSVCHGDRGNGRSRASGSLMPPPRNFTAPESARELTRDRMIFSVTYGRANTAMGAWGSQLSTAEIEAVVDYVRETFMASSRAAQTAPAPHGAAGTAAAPPPAGVAGETDGVSRSMTEPMPHELEGNVTWGGLFYNANCSVCHGADGTGNGPRSRFIFPRPRDFSHPAARNSLNRPQLFEVIARGSLHSEMPAWDKVLTDYEIASVAEYVFQTFIQPASLAANPAGSATPPGAEEATGEAHPGGG